MAAHPEGKHYMALTMEGEVYSWGNGDGGRLGHGDNNSKEEPTLISALIEHRIVKIACGGTYRYYSISCCQIRFIVLCLLILTQTYLHCRPIFKNFIDEHFESL